MPPVLGREPFHIKEHAEALNKFHIAFGAALSQWARIEERLGYWFWKVTGMSFDMARAVFYSARSFQGRVAMLEAAIDHTALDSKTLPFIKAAANKAVQFSGFRNALAHGDPTFDARAGSPTIKQVILVQGKHGAEKAIDAAITVGQLELATHNFRELARLLMDVFESGPSFDEGLLEKCLTQVRALPNQADSATPD